MKYVGIIVISVSCTIIGFLFGINAENDRIINDFQDQAISEKVAYYNSTTAEIEWRNETIKRIFEEAKIERE